MSIPLSAYDFPFPEELIADSPAEPRDSARLLVLRRDTGGLEHRTFRDLPEYLSAGDCLVLNETKVWQCRLVGKKSTGGKAEILLVREHGPGLWSALGMSLKPGMRLEFPGGMTAAVLRLDSEGEYEISFSREDLGAYMDEHGLTPLPPYILKRKGGSDSVDKTRYQTVFAHAAGSIAAPTAGLHFTPELLARLSELGVGTARVTLHVGRGTFRPIKDEDASKHVMLPEHYEMKPEEAAKVSAAMAARRRVVAVGTTSTRTLETLAARPEGFGPGKGQTELYITPGHRWKAVSALITNFHLPKSTPLLLACSFGGRERVLAAYREAFLRRYRLYSYGDAMLIL